MAAMATAVLYGYERSSCTCRVRIALQNSAVLQHLSAVTGDDAHAPA